MGKFTMTDKSRPSFVAYCLLHEKFVFHREQEKGLTGYRIYNSLKSSSNINICDEFGKFPKKERKTNFFPPF